jgi:hypothetical protein
MPFQVQRLESENLRKDSRCLFQNNTCHSHADSERNPSNPQAVNMWGTDQTQLNGLTVTPTGSVKGVETLSVIKVNEQKT